MADEKNKNNTTEEQKENVNKNLVQKAGDWIAAFPEKHPKITKGLKIVGLAAGGIGLAAFGYNLGKNGKSEEETGYDVDTNNYNEPWLEDHSTPVYEDTPQDTYVAPETDFIAEDNVSGETEN